MVLDYNIARNSINYIKQTISSNKHVSFPLPVY